MSGRLLCFGASITAAVSLVFLVGGASGAAEGEVAPMFRGNPERTGYIAEGAEPPLTLRWKFQTRRGVDEIESFPAVDDGLSSATIHRGIVYVGGHDGWMYALDSATGTKRWEYQTGGRLNSAPALHDGALYFGGMDNYYYALRAADGSLLWKTESDKKFFRQIAYGGVRASPIVRDGVVYNGG